MAKKIIILIILCIPILLLFIPINDKKAVVNVSIDDVEISLKDLYNNKGYTSIFQQPFFAYLKSCHDKYNCTFTLYIYGNINNYSDKFKKEFSANSNWLRFGFHAIKPEFDSLETSNLKIFTRAYNSVDSCIVLFAGKESKASALRLHYYYATYDEIEFMKQKGINRLLSADDKRISYSLPIKLNEKLIERNSLYFNGMNYRRTNLRMENCIFPPLDLRDAPKDTIVFFTHEMQLNSRKGKIKFDYCLWFLCKQNCKFEFI